MHSNGRRFCLQCYLRLWNWEKGNDNNCPGIKCPGDNCHPKKLLYGSAVINKILAIFRAVIIVSSLIGVTRRTTRRTPHQNLPDRIELMVWNLADRHILTRLRKTWGLTRGPMTEEKKFHQKELLVQKITKNHNTVAVGGHPNPT